MASTATTPKRTRRATLFRQLTYKEVRERNLRVMDPTAIAHCMEHDMPILVFNYRKEGNIERAVRGEDIGTRVSSRCNGEEVSHHRGHRVHRRKAIVNQNWTITSDLHISPRVLCASVVNTLELDHER